MIVSELIEELQKCPPYLAVSMVTEASGVQHDFPVAGVVTAMNYRNDSVEGIPCRVVLIPEEFS